jgi:hypothetical protein
MIKNYKDYLREEIDWKNLFRRDKKQHLPYEYSDIDPYHEEIWDEEELTPVLNIVKKQGIPYDQVTFLSISSRNLDSLEGIENLINLKHLSCWNNNLTNLKGIENLIQLKYINYDSNNLTNLNGIENLIEMETLLCSRNNLTNLNGIEKLTNLRILWCSRNNFSNEYKEYLINYCQKKKINLHI